VGLKPEDLKKIIHKYDGLVVRSATKVTADVIGVASNLKVIGRAGVGVDNIDVPEATKHGVLVMNTPGGNTVSTAQLAISLLCSAARSIPQADMSMKDSEWARSSFMGTEMSGKTLAIIGCGRIGQTVADWGNSMNMKVIGYDPVLSMAEAREAGIQLNSNLSEIWAEADFVTLHTPLTPDTRNLVDDAAIEKCKEGVIFVNCARGGIIDEDALLRGLESGKVGGAALDVFPTEPPPESSYALLRHPRVVCTPHLGASTDEAQINVARDIAEQMCNTLEHKGFDGVMNARHLSLSTVPAMQPFMNLGETLGKLSAQLLASPIQTIKVETWGGRDISVTSQAARDLIMAMVQKGALQHTEACDSKPNLISAPFLANTVGIQSIASDELPSLVGMPYRNLITVRCNGEDGKSLVLSGSIFGNEGRVVQMDQYKNFPAFKPDGYLLKFRNSDEPGQLASLLSVLEKHSVNIACLSLGRQDEVGALALCLISCDNTVPQGAVQDLQALGVEDVMVCVC